MGLTYFGIMVAFDAAGRVGLTEHIPILRWAEQGPLTLTWIFVAMAKLSIATAIFVFIMSRYLPEPPDAVTPTS